MKYKEFLLVATNPQIVKQERKRVTFQVQVVQSPVGEDVAGVATEYDAGRLRDLVDPLRAEKPTWPQALELGIFLADALLPGPVRELLVRSLDTVQAEGNRLRVRLMLDGALHAVPWEYVLLNRAGGEATPTDFLALSPDVSIVRHQPAEIAAKTAEARLPAQMIAAFASPAGWPRLQMDKERRVIEEALKGNQHIQVIWKPKATKDTLWDGVDQAHLFHFAGHGGFLKEMSAQPGKIAGQGVLELEDKYGDAEELEAYELANRLREKGVRVAVLGACESGERDDVNVWSSVAAALTKVGLAAVVGMQFPILDTSATDLATEFYRALIAGLTIDEAVTKGRIKVADRDVRGWGTPVLYLRSEDGLVFPEYTADPGLATLRKQLAVESHQEAEIVRGKLNGVRVKVMKDGSLKAFQKIGVLEEGAEATAVDIETLGGGSVEATQQAKEVKGDMTGVSIDSFGS